MTVIATSENPFAEGENRLLRPPSTALVIFGATGDLTKRKLIPALINLAEDDYLPSEFVVIAAARSALSDDEFRARMREGIERYSRRKIRDEVWKKFVGRLFYQQVRFDEPQDFVRLRERLESIGQSCSEHFNYLYYLATSPEFFGPITRYLDGAGLVVRDDSRATNVIVEKPFGHDTASAHELNLELRSSFAEDQIFRIDHYLGKETVQNILVFRFANGIFEPLWNHHYIDHIQITVAESIGVESRAGYFDETGIMRDIVQNHVLQVLSLLCIEPPISLSDANSIRSEKVKVLKSIRRLRPEAVFSSVVRAQYTAGAISGSPVAGYREEKGVDPASTTDTFVALRLEIDNWRWSGVPIYVRVGKRLPKRISEITVHFRRPPDSLFHGRESAKLEENILAIQIQPREGISLKICSKPPGPRMRVRPVVMDFAYDASFGVSSPEAYERLLLDAMKGDATLFTRDDEIEEAWNLLSPIFQAWRSESPPPLHEYAAGTWGPKAAAALLHPSGHRWRRL